MVILNFPYHVFTQYSSNMQFYYNDQHIISYLVIITKIQCQMYILTHQCGVLADSWVLWMVIFEVYERIGVEDLWERVRFRAALQLLFLRLLKIIASLVILGIGEQQQFRRAFCFLLCEFREGSLDSVVILLHLCFVDSLSTVFVFILFQINSVSFQKKIVGSMLLCIINKSHKIQK